MAGHAGTTTIWRRRRLSHFVKSAFLGYMVCTLHFSTPALIAGVPVAASVDQQQRGLSNLANVEPGMLFTWPDSHIRTFWMHQTHVPLQVLFLGTDGMVQQIEEMAPESDVLHYSSQLAREALELPAGRAGQLGIKVGDRLVDRTCAVAIEAGGPLHDLAGKFGGALR